MIFRCPGSRSFREPRAVDKKCPSCGYAVEMWTDEATASCPRCKATVAAAIGASCLDWCAFAKECAGEDIYAKRVKNKK